MTRILSVDDSKSIRNIVGKQCIALGFDVDEAENGQEGLARLAETAYDLVVLDVTMPVMDGPAMLRNMREAGQKTPVLLLTSESKRSIVADAMALGIDDYILKPFKPDEFAAKVLKALKLASGSPAATSAPSTRVAEAVESGGKQFVDLLLIDDMENVSKKLRTMLDPQVSMNYCASAQAAFAQCRERVYNLILIDTDIPDVHTRTLLEQLKLLQPNAAMVALLLRTANDATTEMRALGFDSVLFKPFDATSLEELVLRHFGTDELVVRTDNVMRLRAFTGKEDRVDSYFLQTSGLIEGELGKIAAACFENACIDLTDAPLKPALLGRFIASVREHSDELGLTLRMIGSEQMQEVMKQFAETADLRFFRTAKEAADAE